MVEFRNSTTTKEGDGDESMVFEDDRSDLPNLPPLALVALASLIEHLKAFSLTTIFRSGVYTPFAEVGQMNLGGNTLVNLEIFQNATDFTERGTLLEVLSHTKSLFGRRLLQRWISAPLLSIDAINDRLDAVAEIIDRSSSPVITKLNLVLKNLPDLERGLSRIALARATPAEVVKMLQSLSKIANVFDESADDDDEGGVDVAKGIKSTLLRKIVSSLPSIKSAVDTLLDSINVKQAIAGTMADMFQHEEQYPELQVR